MADDTESEHSLRQKYQEEIQCSRKLEGQVVQMKRKVENATKDKENASTQLSRANALKAKLENVCRQLQKQNKAIQEESLARADEDREQRNDLSVKFNQTIQDITQRMGEHTNDKDMLLRERSVLQERIGNLQEQYDLRDQHYKQQLKAKDLQLQLFSTRLKQQFEILEQEAMQHVKYRHQIDEQSASEEHLKSQLQLYSEKFAQFHATLTHSNQVFGNFKSDLKKMAARVEHVVNYHKFLRIRVKIAEKSLTDITQEREIQSKKLAQLELQNDKLKRLCVVLKLEIEKLEANTSE